MLGCGNSMGGCAKQRRHRTVPRSSGTVKISLYIIGIEVNGGRTSLLNTHLAFVIYMVFI